MVDENFAAGVLYAIDNVHNTTYNVLVYNMGASSTQVSVHSHDTYNVKQVRASGFGCGAPDAVNEALATRSIYVSCFASV